ncbi:MAG TPA: NAD-dependent epimerase/dehydratase family protein [Tepidisphaeraceae bacterium]|nr:NAD-dependent epimerase/dehydratase family protein [Tepidisphaeraceae bacterium]
MNVLITGSSGLIGSELVTYFAPRAKRVTGVDNNMRADFFGRDGDTTWNLRRLMADVPNFAHAEIDVRDRDAIWRLFRRKGPFDLIIHAAAQPSHDLAAKRALDDFDVNAGGTVNMLQATRELSPEAVFVLLSTNKVYGDAPNEVPLVEQETRWEYARPEDYNGITEEMRIDRSKHSIFGAGKVAADVMTQEYGRYFGMRTAALRGGCLTGPNHSGVELHGFLSYLIKTQLTGRTYNVYGYKGKQVRDNIHSLDVARAVEAIYRNPRCGEAYNLGGGRANSCSILEAFAKVEAMSGKRMTYEYVDKNRDGDHICYISDLAKFKSHYPDWDLTKSLDDIFGEIIESWRVRLNAQGSAEEPTKRRAIVLGADLVAATAEAEKPLVGVLAERVKWRDEYLTKRDPLAADRLLWRAQTFRHLVHLLPGQSVLELGVGAGLFTPALAKVTRGENPITAVSFAASDQPASTPPANAAANVEHLVADRLPGPLEGRRFDYVIAHDMLDERTCAWLLSHVHDALKPGGHVVFYDSNPWNPMLRFKRGVKRVFGRTDPRRLLSRDKLYELMSELGFIRSFAVYNDFVYSPLTASTAWAARNASILLENAPVLNRMAGSILVHGQKPPRTIPKPAVSLADHKQLHGQVSVVIPCHNEQANIEPLIHRLRDHFDPYLKEIIPVDDNSRDSTRQVIEKLMKDDPRIRPVFRTPPNGVGRALKDGYAAATGNWVLSMDCDFQHLMGEIRDLFDAAASGDYDVVVGSRFSRHSVLLNYPFQKIVANRGFHALAQLVLLRRFRDLTNNLKLVRRDVLSRLVLNEPGFAANAETGLQPLFLGYRIKEVPIAWINRTPDMGSSSFKLVKVGGGYTSVLWNLWRRAMFNKGPYAALAPVSDIRKTWREEQAAPAPAPHVGL